MGFVVSDAERDVGVVYLDATRRDLASTHALVIGVGQYASGNLLPLSSPPLAARIMTEWFLDGMVETKPGGFFNTEKPLGSLSVLLSELPKDERSQIASASVPRATFDNVQRAVESWIERASSHSDNFLFLFISSHGESFGRRTAFLLEDYGTKRNDVTAGMSEIEQFVEALTNVKARQQLLIFDCCRTPTPLGLRFDQEFGNRLINLPSATDRRIRRAHVLRSTGLGFEAWGHRDGPTVFAQVLLDALRGLAASSDDWTVNNFGLAHTVARLLDLHERDGEPLQMPDSQLNAPFIVSAVPPTDSATVFVSLGPQHDFSTCSIRVDDKPVERTAADAAEITPFVRLELPKYQARKIAALDATGHLIGETRIEPIPPVSFRELPDPFEIIRVPGKKGYAALSGRGQISISLDTPAASPLLNSIAVIKAGEPQTAPPVTLAISADRRSNSVSVEPGRHEINLHLPDGRTLSSTVNVKADAIAEVALQAPGENVRPDPPPQNAEALTAESTTGTHGLTRTADPRDWLRYLGFSKERIFVGEWNEADIYAVPISSAFARLIAGSGNQADPKGGADAPQLVTLRLTSPGVFSIEDKMARRIPQRLDAGVTRSQQADQPIWTAAAGGGWREIAAMPSIGVQGKFQKDATGERDSWTPRLLVTPTPRAAASHAGIVVDTCQWSGLLAFLARRDFQLSALVLEDLVGAGTRNNDTRNALLSKVENPMVAAAAALVAVATGRLTRLKMTENWLRDLAKWFPLLPDGPVILARHLMSLGEAGRAEAKAQLLEADRRGVPLFSLSVDWLAQGLADFGKDPETAGPAKTSRRLAQLCDPTRAFTVLRIPIDED